MPALRRNRPSVAPADIVGTAGMPGQNFGVSFSIAASSSGFIADGSLGVLVSARVTVSLGSANAVSSAFPTSSLLWPGTIRQLTMARASWGSALSAWPPSSRVATQVVRICAL